MHSEKWVNERIAKKTKEKKELQKKYENNPNFEVAMVLGYLSALYDVLDLDLDEDE